MKFTYKAYSELIDLLKGKGYSFADYFDYKDKKKTVIFRHDVDFSLSKALQLAKLEKVKGIKSTYFILLSTDFYNVFSKESYKILKEIQELNHEIGLHFDEKRYDIKNLEKLEHYIIKEKNSLELLLDNEVRTVSMHRPSKRILENDIQFKNILNTYSKTFFKEFKYMSDSRMNWREVVLNIIEEEKNDKLHILTHPFWYSEREETMKQKLYQFINIANKDRYSNLKLNFKDLNEVIQIGDIQYEDQSK
ncbi:hypothetical protein JSY36_07920 [Bacillus sp. H-16]|uniref:hypothetical protein n=1 Tax=Alteribacter salitolerans TaxID=2912333 RepID=UPI00196551EC|nr:hypothetical protein [Alteribacter salitolerans]MBM7095678.1 hypothetical protein [Alteribacter salitolerans]